MDSSTPIPQGNVGAQQRFHPARILFLAANPPNTTRLLLDEEIHSIRQALSRTYYRDQFDLISEFAVRVDELQDLLLRYEPDIVHFSGHGSPSNEIIFARDDGSAQAVNPAALADLFRILKENIRCVVLNACFSEVQAQAIAQYVDVVVGMSNPILDKASIGFATAFYRALGYGRSLKSAFELGCLEIDLRGLPDADIPQLVATHIDPEQITFAGPQSTQPRTSLPLPGLLPPIQDNNRTAILNRVDKTWITGVLEQSLQGKAALNLHFEEWYDVLHNPWGKEVKFPSTLHRTLLNSNDILTVFKDADGSLLILGEPGAGKTTLMLLIAKAAVDHARLDPTQPIPVVLHLASWPTTGMSLAQWVVHELCEKYLIPTAVARNWVMNNHLLYLFDGLDEVNERVCVECVQVINEFCKEHVASIVVCSRVAEYLALSQKLQLNRAVYIRPLTAEQINQYIRDSGSEYANIVELLRTDEVLTELAQTPLMLNILSAAYRKLPVDTTAKSVEARRHDILAAYVATMDERHIKEQHYAPDQRNNWLRWLACHMQEHMQAEFFIERLQPTWLVTPGQRLLYHVLTRLTGGFVMLIISIIAGVIGGLFLDSVLTGFRIGVFTGIWFTLAFLVGSMAGVLCNLGLSTSIAMALTTVFAYFVPTPMNSHTLSASLLVGIVFGLPGGLAGISIADLKTISISDKLTLAWRRIWRGMALSTALALAPGLVNMIFIGKSPEYFLRLSLDVWVILMPTLILVVGLSRSNTVDKTVYPNQGIWRSVRNAMIPATSAIIFSMIIGIVISVILRRILRPEIGASLIFSLPIGIVIGFIAGGSTCIQHIILRTILGFSFQLPWNIRKFLDDTVDHGFVHRSGGAYLFVHRLLRDYFSGLKGDSVP